MSKKQHYTLFSGEVSFIMPNDEKPIPRSMNVNGVHRSDTSKLGAKELMKLQTAMQMSFHTKFQRFNGSTVIPSIFDVVVLSLTYLGEFTEESFNAGMPSESPSEETPKEKTPEP